MADVVPTLTFKRDPTSRANSSSLGTSVGSDTTIDSTSPSRRWGTKPYRSIRSAGIDRKRSWSMWNWSMSAYARR